MFLLFYFEHQTLNGTVRPHDNARPYAARNTTQFLGNNNVQNSPLERGGETCSRQSERPRKCVQVVSGTQARVVGHLSASDLQPDPFLVSEILGSY